MTHSFHDRRSPFRRAAVVFGACALALAAPALAQLGLPDNVVNATAIGDAEKQQITKHVDSFKTGLTGADVEKSRKGLLAELNKTRGVSTAFRLEYAAQLLPIVRPLAADVKDEVAINATRMLGELATPEALTALAAALKDKRPAIRLVAAMGYQRTFAVNSAAQPVILTRNGQTALKDLDVALQAEPDPRVADAIVLSMVAAVDADQTRLPGLRADAVRAISGAIIAKARDAKAISFAGALGRAADAMFDLVKDVNAVPRELVPDAAGVSGAMFALAIRTGCTGLSPAQRQEFEQVLIRAEKAYIFSRKKLEGTQPADLNLSESFCANADKFRKDAVTALNALTDPNKPYQLSEARVPTK